MKYGHFDDAQREYVINTPRTPYPWINYLGSEAFFSIISNTSGGYSFYRDARFRRITRYQYNNSNLDMNGKYFYINDSGMVWNPGWKPTKTELDDYECRHGLGYTKIMGLKHGLRADVLAFVPVGIAAEVQLLTLKNETDMPKSIKLFSYVEFCLWNALEDMTNFQRTFSIARAECRDKAILHFTDYSSRRNHFAFYWTNGEVVGFECDRETFTGTHHGLDWPDVVMNGEAHNSTAYGWNPIACHQIQVNLPPGEEKQLVFILGYVENPIDQKWTEPGVINTTPMIQLIQKLASPSAVLNAWQELKIYWNDLLASFQVDIDNEHVRRMVNIWNQYQCMVTFNMSRSASFFESGIGRGLGFRDSNQDLLGFVHQVPERARERLIELASTQFPDGGAYHQYQPLTKRGNHEVGGNFNDDPLWMICGVSAYIKETGDLSILKEMVPFDNNREDAAPMFEHLKRSFYHVVNNLGPHGLPLIGRADWNDCLNFNIYNNDPDVSFQTGPQKTDGQTAESVMIAGAFVLYGREFVDLCEFIGQHDAAEEAHDHILTMIETINQQGWDGEWFLRAYDAQGSKFGSRENEEGQIFIESQGFCGMAGIGTDDGRLEKTLNSVKERLDCPYGIVLNSPPFSRYYPEYGEISTYIPGYKENAGIFCHNNPWIMIAETVLGRGEQAYDYWEKISPSFNEAKSDRHRTEPYVYAQMIAGKDAIKPGEAKNSWLTGTAAWNFVAITQHILGIRPQLNGLKVEPCIPKKWDGFSIKRKFRGVNYSITVANPDHVNKGVKGVRIDGQPADSNLLPIFEAGTSHDIEIILG